MPIDELRDIPAKITEYLNTKVKVTISPITPATGNSLGPGEKFTFKVTVANANAVNLGVALRNVKYQVEVDNDAAMLVVPLSGGATDLAGIPVPGGAVVRAFIFYPGGDNFELGVGETDSLAVTGIAASAPDGGVGALRARIRADVDLTQLFPRGEDTPPVTRLLEVTG